MAIRNRGNDSENPPPNTTRLSLKIRKLVGWVEERNPTFAVVCWVSQSLNPTYKNP
jgi:hypothetical protein